MFEKQLENIKKVFPLVEIVKDDKITAMTKFLYDRITHPESYILVMGETSCGKSTLINSLIGEHIIPVGAEQTTGQILEVELIPEDGEEKFITIYEDASYEYVSEEEFKQQSFTKPDNVNRLKVRRPAKNPSYTGMRVFDSPGYNSVIVEHEEILSDFVSNSDVILYVVNYSEGFQRSDLEMLSALKKRIRKDVDVILAINRCPRGAGLDNPRVESMMEEISSTFWKTKTFLIEKVKTNSEYADPDCLALWDGIAQAAFSRERKARLADAFDGYIRDLYEKCYEIIANNYFFSRMQDEELEKIKEKHQETARKLRDAIPTIINPAFEKLKSNLPSVIDSEGRDMLEAVFNEIEETPKSDMVDYKSMLNQHIIPFHGQRSVKDIQRYILVEMEDLNRKVDDYIQTELIALNDEIQLVWQSNTGATVEGIARKEAKNYVGRMITGGLDSFFKSFGGAGGANAGIANAASHGLKQIGDLFGHTFSRETHNALKHTLKQVGATSMKRLTAAIGLILDVVIVLFDYATWKAWARPKVKKTIAKWCEDIKKTIIEDISSLYEKNIETVNEVADKIGSFKVENDEESHSITDRNMKLAIRIGNEIN